MIFLRLGLGAVVARWVQVRRPQNKGEDSGTRWHYNCLQMLKMIRLPFWDNLAQVKLFLSFLLRGQDLWFWILLHKCEEMGLAHKHRKSSNLSFGAIFIHMKKIVPSLLFETILQDKASIKSCSTDNARNKYDVWVKLQSLVLVRNWSWCTGPSDANREALIRKNVHLALLLLVNSAPHKLSKTLTAWRWRPIQNRSTILFRKLYDDTGQWTVNIVTSHNISVQRCAQWSERE